MTAPQVVIATATALVVTAIGLACAGVGVLAGVGWALVTAGALIGPCAASAAAVLLRDDRHE